MAKFRLELDPVPLKKGADVAGKALDNLGNKAKKTETKVVASATKSGNAFTRMGQKLDGRTRFIFNNTANQLGDMAVQGSMGTDMFRVMGMQLPQLAGGFALLGGSLGIVMPILGVLAAIGFPIIAAFRAASGEAKSFSESLDNLGEQLTLVTKLTRQSLAPINSQAQRFDDVAIAVRAAQKAQMDYNKVILNMNLDENFRQFGRSRGNVEQFRLYEEMIGQQNFRNGNQILGQELSTIMHKTRLEFGLTEAQAIKYLNVLSDVSNTADNEKDRIDALNEVHQVTKAIFTEYGGNKRQLEAFREQIESSERLLAVLEQINENTTVKKENALQIQFRKEQKAFKHHLNYMLYVESRMAAPTTPVKKKREKTPVDKELQQLEAYVNKIKPVITLTQDYEFAVSMLDRALEREVLTQQEHAEKLTIITDKYQIATGAALDFNKIATSASRDLGNSLMSLAEGTTTVKDAFKSMATNIIKELYRVMVVQQAVRGIMGAFGYSQGSTGGYIPTPVPSNEGGGYTGSGSRSGGVDGRGGFHAILHPQETVVDHTKGQGLGTTINQTINVSTGVQQTVRTEIIQLMPKIAETTKMAVLDAKRRGGSFSAAFN